MNQQVLDEIKQQLQDLLNQTISTSLIETADLQNQILDILNNLNKLDIQTPCMQK